MPVPGIEGDVRYVDGLRALQSSADDPRLADRHADHVAPGEARGGERLRSRVEVQQGGVAHIQEFREGVADGVAQGREAPRRNDLPKDARQALGLLVAGPCLLVRALRGAGRAGGSGRARGDGSAVNPQLSRGRALRALAFSAMWTTAAMTGAIAVSESISAWLKPSADAWPPSLSVDVS